MIKESLWSSYPTSISRHTWSGNVVDVKDRLVISTSTFYKGDDLGRFRAGLALDFFQRAHESGYEVVCVDGGSYDGFRQEAGNRGVDVIPGTRQGFGEQMRESINIASTRGKEYILRTEPEKIGMVRLAAMLGSALACGETDHVVPYRTEDSWKTYPTMQRSSERAINDAFAVQSRQYLDLAVGPKVLRRGDVEAYEEYARIVKERNLPDSWDAILVPTFLLKKGGVRVHDVEADYIHPDAQTRSEEGNIEFDKKRVLQLDAIVSHTLPHILDIIRS